MKKLLLIFCLFVSSISYAQSFYKIPRMEAASENVDRTTQCISSFGSNYTINHYFDGVTLVWTASLNGIVYFTDVTLDGLIHQTLDMVYTKSCVCEPCCDNPYQVSYNRNGMQEIIIGWWVNVPSDATNVTFSRP